MKHRIQIGSTSLTPIDLSIASLGKTSEKAGIFIRLVDFLDSAQRWSTSTTIGFNTVTAFDVPHSILPASYDLNAFHWYVIGKFNYNWYRDNTGSFYSGLGLGFGSTDLEASNNFLNEYTVVKSNLALQITAIGAQANLWQNTSKTFGLGIFGELGYGDLGIVNFGVQLSF